MGLKTRCRREEPRAESVPVAQPQSFLKRAMPFTATDPMNIPSKTARAVFTVLPQPEPQPKIR